MILAKHAGAGRTLFIACALVVGCSVGDLRPSPEVIFARFDPAAKKIPMPTDILRDDTTGLLALDAADPELTPAEREVYEFLNTLEGWPRGGTISVVVRGGADGVVGARGEAVECHAAFYFLRLQTPLNAHPDYRAFPGATRAEREETARDLEELRRELAADWRTRLCARAGGEYRALRWLVVRLGFFWDPKQGADEAW